MGGVNPNERRPHRHSSVVPLCFARPLPGSSRVACEHDARRPRRADRAERRRAAVHRDDDRPAVVAAALQPPRHVQRPVRRAVQQHPQDLRRARRRVRAPRPPRPRARRTSRRTARGGDVRAAVPHGDRRQPRARRLGAAQRGQGPARQGGRRHGARLRRPALDLSGAPAPDAASPARLVGRHLRRPVRRRMALRQRHDQPGTVRGDRVRRDVRVVGRLHAMPRAARRLHASRRTRRHCRRRG